MVPGPSRSRRTANPPSERLNHSYWKSQGIISSTDCVVSAITWRRISLKLQDCYVATLLGQTDVSSMSFRPRVFQTVKRFFQIGKMTSCARQNYCDKLSRVFSDTPTTGRSSERHLVFITAVGTVDSREAVLGAEYHMPQVASPGPFENVDTPVPA